MPYPVFCPNCGVCEPLSPERWRCDCGGAWEPTGLPDPNPDQIPTADYSVWRYRTFYGLKLETPTARLGAGWTPLVSMPWYGRDVWLKLEHLAPTGSFKDRGTEVMINLLAHQGVTRVVDDSSGNAGASVAAYAARAGLSCDIFVPAYASPAKQAQIAIYGAHVHPIPGVRAEAQREAWKAAAQGATYASHAYHPAFLAGQQSVAWELWEQLGHRAPNWYIVPVGQGLHLLGAWLGFRRLLAAGLVSRMPRLVAVQPVALAPICRAFAAGLDTVPPLEPRATSPGQAPGFHVAEGLAIAAPVRGARILEALRDTGGTCLSVEDGEILRAQRQLACQGLYVEPTSATVIAALEPVLQAAAPDDLIVVPLTGSGLKSNPSTSIGV